MRKILIFIIAINLVSCEKWLDVEPQSFIENDVVFTTRDNVEAAVIGCYNALQYQHYYGRNFVIICDLLSDNSFANGTKVEYRNLDENIILSDNIVVEGIWADIYSAINSVNFTINGILPTNFLSASEKEDLLGQLYFLRGLHYFNLVRLFGGIPLKLNPTENDAEYNFLPRSTTDKVYDQIIKDLKIAESTITNTDITRATQVASKSLLALVYLTIEDFDNALLYSNEVMSNSTVEIEQNIANLYDDNAEQCIEMLFYIPFSADDKNRLAEYHYPYQLGGRHENAPTEKLVSLVQNNDNRRLLIAETYNELNYCNKYQNIADGSDGVIVFRLSEILFIRTEARYYLDSIANKESILDDLNTIRHRANLDSLSYDYSGSLVDVIQTEKQIEFAFEGKRWFDLVRTNSAIKNVETVTNENQMLLPIPLSEILSNPNISSSDQNPGY